MKIAQNLKLPCGVTLSNRLAKSAMSENMATGLHAPGKEFPELYRRWSEGGVGLCITGNVMVDSRYLGESHNVVIEKGIDNRKGLQQWASAKSNTETQIWVQLNHVGKQSPSFLCPEPVAPSAVKLEGGFTTLFNTPRELTDKEIHDIIERFGYAAKVVKECGFDGVQIHGAHGYLVSQFLSSRHNQRQDEWGGTLEKRMRFVEEVYLSIRKNVGPEFPIGIKINSADFQKGGFTHEESVQVAKKLSELGIDLIEISGGSYENPIMMGAKDSTRKREAYFLEYAKSIKEVIKCPLLVTGGFRTLQFMESTLEAGELDLIGLARPLALDPDLPRKLLNAEPVESLVHPLSTGIKALDKRLPLEIIWYTEQLHRMGAGKDPNPKAGNFTPIFKALQDIGINGIKRVRAK